MEPKEGQGVEIPCTNCGKILRRFPYRIKQSKNQFCDSACHDAYRLGKSKPEFQLRVTVHCSACGKPLDRQPNQLKGYKHYYCDKVCAAKGYSEFHSGTESVHYNSATVCCTQCGDQLIRKLSDADPSNNHFCDHNCYGLWLSDNLLGSAHPKWRGGAIYYYGPNWIQQRKIVRERDNYTCQLCKRTEEPGKNNYHVHHRIPFRNFNYIAGANNNYLLANALDNLVLLCRRCHTAAEWNPSLLTATFRLSR